MKHKRKVLHIGFAALALALLLMASLPSQALAQADSTTVGTLSLTPAFENIGVISNFAGDDNGDNNAILEYREVGSSTWKPGIPMTVDRRDELWLYDDDTRGTVYVPNSWKNQWRAIIFGLEPNTEYEVRVTYTDPDGVSGSPVIGAVRTRNDNPPSNGNTYYVSTTGSDSNPGTFDEPLATIQHAADIVNPGDTVLIMPGTYTEDGPRGYGITIARSGEEDNYITFQSYDMENMAIIDAEYIWRKGCLSVLGPSYIRIKGLTMRYSGGDAAIIEIETASDRTPENIIVEDCHLYDPGEQYANSGVLIRQAKNILVQRNLITMSGVGRTQQFGVFFWGFLGGGVIRDNTIIGPFKDGIGGSGNHHIDGGAVRDSYVYNNYIQDTWDDGIEMEGGNINIAIWNNIIKPRQTNYGRMGLGLAPVIIGPTYAFRNVLINCRDAAIKIGASSSGNMYLYHNTMYTTHHAAHGVWHVGDNAIAENVTSRNNIIRLIHGRLIRNQDTSGDKGLNSYDYDNVWTNRVASGFSVTWYHTTYGSLAAFQAGTGQELHGISVEDNLFVNPDAYDFALQAGSPCIDKGVFLPGFNDADFPWSYQGAAPDIGAYESAYGEPPGPLHHIIVTPASVSLEFSQTQQFTVTGYDQNDNEIIGLSFAWSVINAGAGSIDGNGLFTAGTMEGTYPDVVKAEAESIAGYASVSITVTAPSFPWVLFGGVLGGVLAALAAGVALYLVVLRPRGSDPQRIDYLRRKVRDAIVRVLNRRKRL